MAGMAGLEPAKTSQGQNLLPYRLATPLYIFSLAGGSDSPIQNSLFECHSILIKGFPTKGCFNLFIVF